MEIAFILVREVTMLAMLICLGIFTRKKGIFTEDTARRMSDFLIAVVMPVLVVNTLHREKDPALLPGFWASVILAALTLILSAGLSGIVFRRGGSPEQVKAERLAAVLPNCAFMGIPVLLASTGEDSLIYCAGFIGAFNFVVWCWAVPMLEGRRPSALKLLINPGVLSFIAGMTVFLLEIRLPALAVSFMGYISDMNTPLSMLMIGVFLAGADLKGIFSARILKVTLARNLAIPLLLLLAIRVLRLDLYFGRNFALSFVILAACSSAASSLLLPVRAGYDGEYPAKLIAASNLALIVTMPLVALAAQSIL